MDPSDSRRSSQRGLALVLVMTVVLALVIVATPFVLSMLLQERVGTRARYASQADYGAEGAKNYAVWRLMFSLDPIERRYATGIFSSYYYDTAQEFDIRLDDIYLQKVKVSDPKGGIWGLGVQDDQGKLNVRSAPTATIARIQQMVDGRIVGHKDYLTLYSGRDTSWCYPQRLRVWGNPTASSGGITVDNLHILGPGARIRVTKPGLRPFESTVSGNAILSQTSNTGFDTNPAIPGGYLDGVVEVEMRHPVNLNTARRETLVAIFEGLSIYEIPTSEVDRGTAFRLANAFAGRQVRRLEDFATTLVNLDLRWEQRAAVLLNAVCPTAAVLQGSGTLGITFKSYDVYSIEAFSSQNSPVGSQIAGRGFREIVSVAAPSILDRSCESQYDFDMMLAGGTDVSGYAAAVAQQVPTLPQDLQGPTQRLASAFRAVASGYPFGNRFVSFPRMMPVPGVQPVPGQAYGPSDTALKNQQKGPNEAFVQMAAARDTRGQSQYDQILGRQGWPNGEPREHFDNALEGKKLAGSAHAYPWGQVFTTMPSPAPNPDQQHPDIAAGGMEIWVRFDAISNPVTIFDLREQDWSNRLTLRVENNELIFTACDATIGIQQDPIDNGAAEVRMPFSPVPDTWYHFGAYWKGTRYAQLALLVDGFPHPQQKFSHVNPEGNKVITKLTAALTQNATSISLQDDSFLPGNLSPLLIGDEVLLYDKSAGTLIRGARGTQAVSHPSQVAVQIFGYSSKLRTGQVTVDGNTNYPPCPYDRVTTGGATVRYNFGLNPQAQVAGDKQDTVTMQWYVDSTATQIGVTTPNIMDFPDQGYITIEQEVIFYTGRSTGGLGGMPPGTAKFTGCTRGQQGTAAMQHDSGKQIHMWGIPVTNTTNYLSPTIVAIGDEWFGPVQKDPTKTNFWISFVVAGSPPQPLRLRRGNGVFGSLQQAHSAGDKVIPTFICRESDPQAGRFSAGRFDRVTIMDANNQKEQARIRHTGRPWPLPGQNQWTGMRVNLSGAGGEGQIVAFEDNVSRAYVADDLHTRILKFPSGELLGLNWLEKANPSFSIGPMGATIDEIKFFAAPKQPLQLAQQADASVASLQVTQGGGVAQFGGLIKVGDEYIGYGRAGGGNPRMLTQVKRGWLNSTPEVHDAGDLVFSLPWVPVTSMQNDLSATDRFIYLNQRLPGRQGRGGRAYNRGYLLIDSEMILFEGTDNNGQLLIIPPTWDGQTGLYRGMFGTAPAAHAAQASLVYGMPWRFWDTYKRQEFDNTMAYVQWSTKMDLAHWYTMRWTQEIPLNDPNLVVHALVRIDGKGEIWDPPGMTDKTLLLEFVTPGASCKINRTGYLQDAGQIDVRFYVEYKLGSFDSAQPWSAHSWKRTPKIKELRVEYDRPVQTLYHEDR